MTDRVFESFEDEVLRRYREEQQQKTMVTVPVADIAAKMHSNSVALRASLSQIISLAPEAEQPLLRSVYKQAWETEKLYEHRHWLPYDYECGSCNARWSERFATKHSCPICLSKENIKQITRF